MADFEVTVQLNDEYVDLAGSINIVINRGIEASTIELITRDDEVGKTRFDDFDNPVTLKITTPDNVHEPKTLELEKWHIARIEPHATGFWRVILRDNRWATLRKRVTVAYNVYMAGYGNTPVPRESSLNGGAPWKCYEAAKDAIEKFGLDFTENPELSQEVKLKELPKNLGNSLAGGFVEETFDRMLPLLLNPINCDPVIMPDGSLKIVDRNSPKSVQLEEYTATAGMAMARKLDFAKPKNIKIRFEQRVGRFFAGDDSETAATSDDIAIENVIPREVLNEFDDIVQEGHVELFSEVRAEWSITPAQIRERWLKPLIIPQDTNDDISTVEDKDKWESWLRECYRQRFRVVDDDEQRSLVNLKIGHLGKNGSTRSERSVYMSFAYFKAYSQLYKQHDYDDIEQLEITKNKSLDYKEPAPWLAVFFVDSRGELLFQLIPQLERASYARDLIIGPTEEPVSAGDYFDLTVDGFIIPASSQSALKAGWFFRVYYHGLLVDDRPDLGLNRLHEQTRSMFPEGKIEEIEYFVSDITANWGHETPADLETDTLSLLNIDEINERADDIAEQVKRNFSDGNAGVLQTAGLDAIVNGKYWTGGDIHSLQIQIGAKKPYSVECLWTVMPEVRPVYVNRLKLSGEPVGRIG